MNGRSVKLASALLATSALAATAAYVDATSRARTAVHLALAGRAGMSVGGVSANPFLGRVTLRDVVAGSGRTSVRIGALRLPLAGGGLGPSFGLVSPAEAFPMGDAAPSAPAPSAPAPMPGSGSASADDVVIIDGPVTYRIKHIELAGTPLSNAELATLLDPKSADTIEARLRKITAASVTISELTADSAVGDSEQHLVQKQILLANVVAGKAAIGSSGPSTLAAKAKDNISNFEVGGLQLADVDTAQLVHVFATARVDDSEKLLPLFDSVTANAIKLTDVKTNNVFTIGSLKEQGLKGRAFKKDLRTESAELANAKPNDPASNAFLDDVLNSTSVQLFEVNDIASVPPPGTDPGYTGFGIAKIAAHDIGGGRKIGGIEMRNIHLETSQGKMALASADMGAFSFPLAVPAAETDKARPPSLASFNLANLVFDMNVADKDKPEQKIAFAINSVTYAAPLSNAGPIPPKATASVDHVAFDVRPNDPSTEMLRSLGYKHLDISSQLASSYNAAQQSLSVEKFILGGIDMGSVQLKLNLTNVSDKIVSPNPEVQRASAIAILFKDADLVVRNDGLIDKALQYKATLDGKSVDQEREMMTDFVTNQLPALAGNSPKLKPLETALAKFIAAPKTLHIAIAAKNGLGAADMPLIADPTALLDQLDIQAAANE